MLYELRLTVLDAPGSLARLTALLGSRGIDIREIDFLGSVVGRAVDNLLIDCTPEQAETLLPALAQLDGFEAPSLRRSLRMDGTVPVLDVLRSLAADDPLAAFTAAAPVAFSTDWAVAFRIGDTTRAACTSPRAPQVEWSGWVPGRAMRALPGTVTVAGRGDAGAPVEVVQVPLGDWHVLLLGRVAGPAFHDLEVQRLQDTVTVASLILRRARPAPPPVVVGLPTAARH